MATKVVRSPDYPHKEIDALKKGDTLIWICKDESGTDVFTYQHVDLGRGKTGPCGIPQMPVQLLRHG